MGRFTATPDATRQRKIQGCQMQRNKRIKNTSGILLKIPFIRAMYSQKCNQVHNGSTLVHNAYKISSEAKQSS